MYKVKVSRKALKDFEKLKRAGLGDKAKHLIDVISEDPLCTPPAYEALVGNLQGLYSRRISRQHRLVYEIDDEPFKEKGIAYKGTVYILRAWTHYESVR